MLAGVVSSCTASNNGINGIFATNAKIVDNFVAGHHNSGIQTNGPGLISGNLVFQNDSGIFVLECPCLVALNTAFGNPFANIDTAGSGCTLVNNSAP